MSTEQPTPPQPEPQQSAVEWVIERIRQECPINDTCVLSQDVLELAKRCDEAEENAKQAWIARDEACSAFEDLWDKHSITKAQLAAAQVCGWKLIKNEWSEVYLVGCSDVILNYDEMPDFAVIPFCPACGRRVKIQDNENTTTP